MAGPREPRVEIGYVARAHGIRGEVRVVPHDPESSALRLARSIYVGDRQFAVASARVTSGGFLLGLEGIPDRTAAEALKGQPVAVDRELIADDDSILLSDLVGCNVVLESGASWGQVAAIESSAAQDRLVIHDQGVERMLPIVDAFIVDIDLDGRIVVVDPPEGLPEDELP